MPKSESRLSAVVSEIREKYGDENQEAILAKHFSREGASIALLTEKYQFDRRQVLEIGSSFGQYLLYWGPSSEGVEVQPEAALFTERLGRTTHRINVEDELGVLGVATYEAIHCRDVIEHLVAPHLFLMRLHRLLKQGGLLALSHPIVPNGRLVRKLWDLLGHRGWLASEHINFFTPETIALMLERAGFEVLAQYPPTVQQRAPLIAGLALPFSPSCLSICRKVEGFSYPAKRLALFDPAWAKDELAGFH